MRDPSLRAAELSGATGVASPFVLLYQQPVADVDAAEILVHQTMEARGWRHAGNREFFNAPLHHIVALVFQTASVVQPEAGVQHVQESASVQPILNSACDLENWEDFLTEAQKLHLLGMETMMGADGTFADVKRGFGLICQAADLGDVDACEFAGSVLLDGARDVPRNLPQAYRYLRAAIEAGNMSSHALLAQVFKENGQLNESMKHWQAYFTHTAQHLRDLPEEDSRRVSAARTAGRYGRTYLSLVNGTVAVDAVDPAHFNALAPYVSAVLEAERSSLADSNATTAVKAIMKRDLDLEMEALQRKCGAGSSAGA